MYHFFIVYREKWLRISRFSRLNQNAIKIRPIIQMLVGINQYHNYYLISQFLFAGTTSMYMYNICPKLKILSQNKHSLFNHITWSFDDMCTNTFSCFSSTVLKSLYKKNICTHIESNHLIVVYCYT